MSRHSINVQVDEKLKKELRDLSYDYRMGHSAMVRDILIEGAKRWRDRLEFRGEDDK